MCYKVILCLEYVGIRPLCVVIPTTPLPFMILLEVL